MATRADTVQYIADQAGLGGRLEWRKMFGEYALYVCLLYTSDAADE